jgi:hypothetical protein
MALSNCRDHKTGIRSSLRIKAYQFVLDYVVEGGQKGGSDPFHFPICFTKSSEPTPRSDRKRRGIGPGHAGHSLFCSAPTFRSDRRFALRDNRRSRTALFLSSSLAKAVLEKVWFEPLGRPAAHGRREVRDVPLCRSLHNGTHAENKIMQIAPVLGG